MALVGAKVNADNRSTVLRNIGVIMKLRYIGAEKCQLGWRCVATFTVETANQFTDEEHSVVSGGRWMVSALFNGWREYRRTARSLAAKPGERAAKGWA